MIRLETERLLFRDHLRSDLDAFCALEADPDVRRYVGGAPRPRAAAERKFQLHLNNARRRLALRATILKAEDRYIGLCGLYQGDARPGEATLAFTLAKAYWGRGLATEAGRGFINLGFDQLRLKRIVAVAEVGNAASLRVLEKLGFSLVRTETGPRSFHNFELLNPHRPSPAQ